MISASKKTAKKLKKKAEKPNIKKIKLIKHVNAPLVPVPIPAVPLSSLKGIPIVEKEEAATRPGLPFIYPKAKEKEYDIPELDVHDISAVFDIKKSEDGENPEFEAPTKLLQC